MNHLETRQIIRVLSQKYNLTVQQVEDIIGVVPEFIMTTSRQEVDKLEGHYPTFRVPGWGTFHVSKWVAYYVKNRLSKKLKNEPISSSELET